VSQRFGDEDGFALERLLMSEKQFSGRLYRGVL